MTCSQTVSALSDYEIHLHSLDCLAIARLCLSVLLLDILHAVSSEGMRLSLPQHDHQAPASNAHALFPLCGLGLSLGVDFIRTITARRAHICVCARCSGRHPDPNGDEARWRVDKEQPQQRRTAPRGEAVRGAVCESGRDPREAERDELVSWTACGLSDCALLLRATCCKG